MVAGLTERQREVLDFIKEQVSELGVAPSHAQIAKEIGASSTRAAADHLKALEKKGYIRLHADTPRGIQILEAEENQLPLIGSVAAGMPIEAIENIERFITIPEVIAHRKPAYLLRVRGDSMINEGILDGDLIAVQRVNTASRGEIIVARIEDEVTVKTLGSHNGMPALLPANDDYSPIMIENPEQFHIEGKFVGLIRVH
ncbi:MAG TPA: transcriptional repressor LexA [Aeromonadales bacterium]|nr:transcriptional repressor LexA [Aeromonadales bacterium]